jgi:hypothetical protein
MEFIKANFLNTTTQISVTSNTITAVNLFVRDQFSQYYSTGDNSDLTTTTITISFPETTLVSRIAIVDTNVKSFDIYYNGATANTFPLTTTGSTIASSFTNNSSSNIYLRANTTAVSSITLDLKTTQTPNQDKILGLLVVSDLYYAMPRLPSSNEYKPSIIPKQIVHTLSDGGTRVHNIRNKWTTTIGLDYITTEHRDALKSIWELGSEFNFCPFGTTTSWDGIIIESVWVGPFDFYKYSDNAAVSGWSGDIKLKETPT